MANITTQKTTNKGSGESKMYANLTTRHKAIFKRRSKYQANHPKNIPTILPSV